ncbi:MAG: cytochrome c biogenesis protein CcsA [Elusimicrobiota bacterium]|jgi:ABC-type transport system involved in cytochrome c biogenesis permease subunit
MIEAANLAFALGLAGLAGHALDRAGSWRWCGRAGDWALAAAFAALTAALAARWYAAGRPPMANQYESLLILAWCLSVGGWWLSRRWPVRAAGLLGGAVFTAVLAAASFADPTVRPLMPALRSNWLTYHVFTAMAAYAAFALAAAVAVWNLAVARRDSAQRPPDAVVLAALRFGFFMLTVGIMTGAVWAQRAWGSYWSWDPKETWSLITWLVYAVILHLRRTGVLPARKLAWSCIVGLACVLFTYFGVNFLLGGLHSYSGS